MKDRSNWCANTTKTVCAMSVCCVAVDLDGLDERWALNMFERACIQTSLYTDRKLASNGHRQRRKKWAALRPKAESKHKYYFNPHDYIAAASHSTVQCRWIREVLTHAPWYSSNTLRFYWFSFIKFWFDCQLNRHTFICFVCERVRVRFIHAHRLFFVAIGLPACLCVPEFYPSSYFAFREFLFRFDFGVSLWYAHTGRESDCYSRSRSRCSMDFA